MKKYLIILCLALFIVSAWLADGLIKSKAECERLQGNQESLMAECRLYETKAGESAALIDGVRHWRNRGRRSRHIVNAGLRSD